MTYRWQATRDFCLFLSVSRSTDSFSSWPQSRLCQALLCDEEWPTLLRKDDFPGKLFALVSHFLPEVPRQNEAVITQSF